MIVPGSLSAGLLGSQAGHLSVSIITPLNGSTISNNSTPQAISGIAQSTAGNIATLQYQIDGGSWVNFSFTASEYVNYSGGNAGEIGVGAHTVKVQATDTASNTATATSVYSIAGSPPSPSYSLTPSNIYSGQNNHWLVSNSTPYAAVAYTQTQYNAQNEPLGTLSMTALGTTDSNGNFSLTGTAEWAATAWTDSIQLYVGGVNVANFSESNIGTSPFYSYGPNVAPSGSAITLNITNSWGSSTVSQKATYFPSGTVSNASLGSTSVTGNFSYSTTMEWGTDTTCTIQIYLDGVAITEFNFVP